MKIEKTAVAGTGAMGPGIAAVFAVAGRPVTLVSRRLDSAEAGLESAVRIIEWMVANSLIEPAEAKEAISRFSVSDDPAEAAARTDIFVESIPERLEIKQEYFAMLDAAASPETILCSNTSGISITQIAANCRHPERVFTTHFWNPPHLMPLVEVVMGDRSDGALALDIAGFLDSCGKTAVVVRKDRPGQLGNRIQHAVVRECMHIVEEGIATAEDVDKAIKAGFGLRLPVYGVFEHHDLVGLDLVKLIQDYVLPDLAVDQKSTRIHNEKVARGELGAKTGQGMLSWPEGKAEEVKARRDAFLLDFLKRRKTDRG